MKLSPQPACEDTLRWEHFQGNESTIEDIHGRVAKSLAALEREPSKWEPAYWAALQQGMVLLGRTNSTARQEAPLASLHGTVFVVGDCFSGVDEGGYAGVQKTIADATVARWYGRDVAYDLSRVRPFESLTTDSESPTGEPRSVLEVLDRPDYEDAPQAQLCGTRTAILRVDHPDILAFVRAKREKSAFQNLHFSVAVTDDFMDAASDDKEIPLLHWRAPDERSQPESPAQRPDGPWIHATLRARDIWKAISTSAVEHNEPSLIFVDRETEPNSLPLFDPVETVQPAGQQETHHDGFACRGCIDLTRFVKNPFSEVASFDYEAFSSVVNTGVRMLDTLIDATRWSLGEQMDEAKAKRRIGLGYTGLGSALVMLGVPYNSTQGREVARDISTVLRDRAYTASVELAIERGSFPLFDAENFLRSEFTRRLPGRVRHAIREHGIRNSQLLHIHFADSTTEAFTDNASCGIDPVVACIRKGFVRNRCGGVDSVPTHDRAYRVWSAQQGNGAEPLRNALDGLPSDFVEAENTPPLDHVRMIAEVQPYIDGGISTSVLVPEDCPRRDLAKLYYVAWEDGLKSIRTHRGNKARNSIMLEPAVNGRKAHRDDLNVSDPDRRIVIHRSFTPALDSLRWAGRPVLPDGNNSWCFRVKHPKGANFALFIGEIPDDTTGDGAVIPFEVWINGVEGARGLEALAINLSYDMYARDRGWLKKKLVSLKRCEIDGEGFPLSMPPDAEIELAPSLVAAAAMLIDYRFTGLGVFDDVPTEAQNDGTTPVLDALMSPREPKAGPDGTMSWAVDVLNHGTGDDFALFLKEAIISVDGSERARPYSIWLSGAYPRSLDGLCKALSLDMRVADPAWVGKKLRELLNYAEPKGDFWAPVPGTEKQRNYPSTVAYIARLVIHRFAMLGWLDENGYAVEADESAAPSQVAGR